MTFFKFVLFTYSYSLVHETKKSKTKNHVASSHDAKNRAIYISIIPKQYVIIFGELQKKKEADTNCCITGHSGILPSHHRAFWSTAQPVQPMRWDKMLKDMRNTILTYSESAVIAWQPNLLWSGQPHAAKCYTQHHRFYIQRNFLYKKEHIEWSLVKTLPEPSIPSCKNYSFQSQFFWGMLTVYSIWKLSSLWGIHHLRC